MTLQKEATQNSELHMPENGYVFSIEGDSYLAINLLTDFVRAKEILQIPMIVSEVDWSDPTEAKRVISIYHHPNVWPHLFEPPEDVESLEHAVQDKGSEHRKLFVAKTEDGNTVGAVLYAGPKSWKMHGAWLRSFAVDPEYQSQGIGRVMLEQSMFFIYTSGYQGIIESAVIQGKTPGDPLLPDWQKVNFLHNRLGFVSGQVHRGRVTVLPYEYKEKEEEFKASLTPATHEQYKRNVLRHHISANRWHRYLANQEYRSTIARPLQTFT